MTVAKESSQNKQKKQKPPTKPQPVAPELQLQPETLPLQRALENPELVSPNDILAMQQTFGNQAVSAMLNHSTLPPSPGGAAGTVQRKLINEAERAFNTAKAQNTAYDAAKTLADSNVTTKEQKNLVKLRSTLSSIKSSPTQEKRLKDYIRAFLLKRYAAVVSDTTKTRGRKFYLGKAQDERDKYKALLGKGVTAPETQSFLRSEGFQRGFDIERDDLQVGPKIDVRSTFIGGKILGKKVRAHLFIVYTSSSGKQWYFRGGPGHNNMTVGSMGEYVPGTVDWDPSAPSKTVLEGEEAQGKLDGLMEATSIIDGMQVPYDPGGIFSNGENCNATAWTILDRAGVSKAKPSGRHPGWGHILGSLTKGKEDALPDREDNSVEGEDYRIAGQNKVMVYKDRGLLEHHERLDGQTPVKILAEIGHVAKIRYGENVIAYVDKIWLEKPRGIRHTIGVYTENILKMGSDEMTGHTLDTGDMVEVMDPDFVNGMNGDLVPIVYTVGDERFEGRISDFSLDTNVEGDFAPDDPGNYPAEGKHRVPVKNGQKLWVAMAENEPLNQQLTFDADKNIQVVILNELTTRSGRCRLAYEGEIYYPRLKAVFG